jgi:hypothetical protein
MTASTSRSFKTCEDRSYDSLVVWVSCCVYLPSMIKAYRYSLVSATHGAMRQSVASIFNFDFDRRGCGDRQQTNLHHSRQVCYLRLQFSIQVSRFEFQSLQ